MKVPSEYLSDMLKADSVKDKDARAELGKMLDALQGESDMMAWALRHLMQMQPWTPQLWQNGAQLTLTLDSASCLTFGPLVFLHTRFTVGTAGAVGLMEIRNLPHKAAYSCIGGETVVFVGGVNRIGATRITAGSSAAVMTIDNQASDFGVAPATALAVGNGIRMSALYLRQL